MIAESSRLALSLCFQCPCSVRLPVLPPPPLQDPEARPPASCLHPALLNPQSVFPELGPAATSPTRPQRERGWCVDSCLRSQREEKLDVQMPLICQAQITGGREAAVPSQLKAKKTSSPSLPSLPGRPRTARLTLTPPPGDFGNSSWGQIPSLLLTSCTIFSAWLSRPSFSHL